RAICEVAEDVGAYVVCDEILRGTEVDGVMTPSIVDLYERGICTMSLSKLGLAGLRIGWIVADEETVEGCWSYKDYTSLSHSSLTERLAIIALQRGNFEKILDRARGIIRRNLKVFSEWMRRHDHALSWVEPRAGATAFPEYGLNIDSYEFCERLLREENLLLSPGDLFQFPRHIRIRYAGHDGETLTKALERLHAFLERHA
ncbi:MAG: aminotransferase class I/II-fold pyridoxal phosphate-dependent enzyme, partial [Candidatus Geothermarchaeales archaeon]